MGLFHITKTSSEKKDNFFLYLFCTLSDLSKACLCLAYFLSSTAWSHIPNQTFAHPWWRLSVTGSSCEAERSSCSRVSHICLPGCRANAELEGLRWVNLGPKVGVVQDYWGGLSRLFTHFRLCTTHMRGKAPARAGWPMQKTKEVDHLTFSVVWFDLLHLYKLTYFI